MGPDPPGAFSADLEQVFQAADEPTLPVPQAGGSETMPTYSDSFMGSLRTSLGSTLDEEVTVTLLRDVQRVVDNVKSVLIPGQRGHSKQGLRDWDLWGPFFFVLLMASILASGSSEPSHMFSLVFTLLIIGALVLNLNVVLLGGKIIFFQSLSLIGYCLFPLDVAALLCWLWSNPFYRIIVLMAGIGWACYAAVPFIGSTVAPARQALAVYPVFLLFTSMSWLTLISG